jgi:hypothetical protein
MVNEPGKAPRALSPEETLQLIQKQQQDLQMLVERNKELEEIVVELQNQLLRKTQGEKRPDIVGPTPMVPNDEVEPKPMVPNDEVEPKPMVPNPVKLKSEPDIFVNV